ncbi:MAG: NAD+ synthase [Bacteroidota bacterium]
MKVRLHQLNPTIGDLESNVKGIRQAMTQAQTDGIDVLILPELCVCGYPPQDLLEREAFREACYRMNRELIDSTNQMVVIFGSVTPNQTGVGRPVFNSAIVARNGKEIDRVHKALLPTYDVFDDLRYFEPGTRFEPVEIDGIALGITVCEDIWYNDNEIQYHIYDKNPAELLKQKGADVIVNISASPFTKRKPISRRSMLQKHASQLQLPLLYVNQVGANTELVFDGDSLVFNQKGQMVCRAPRFEEGYVDVLIDPSTHSIQNEPCLIPEPESYQSMFNALKLGLRDYLDKSGAASSVVLGLSGGIDSALVATIAVEALGADRVVPITMPSAYSSEGSVSDSRLLAENLGVELLEIPIQPVYQSLLKQLEPHFKDAPFNVAEENLQSRSRGNILMAFANKFGYMLLNTSNKSELAVGYGTLYGDMAGGLGLISDVYKTEVFGLCTWLNESHFKKEVIPNSIITKPPSAELRPDQKDSDSLPAYETLDPILSYYLEEQFSRSEIINRGFDAELVDRILTLVDRNEHKRFQAPPGLKISAKAFGSGRRWPIVQQWTGTEKTMVEHTTQHTNAI